MQSPKMTARATPFSAETLRPPIVRRSRQKSGKSLGPLKILEVWPERTASGTGHAPSMRISVPHQGICLPRVRTSSTQSAAEPKSWGGHAWRGHAPPRHRQFTPLPPVAGDRGEAIRGKPQASATNYPCGRSRPSRPPMRGSPLDSMSRSTSHTSRRSSYRHMPRIRAPMSRRTCLASAWLEASTVTTGHAAHSNNGRRVAGMNRVREAYTCLSPRPL